MRKAQAATPPPEDCGGASTAVCRWRCCSRADPLASMLTCTCTDTRPRAAANTRYNRTPALCLATALAVRLAARAAARALAAHARVSRNDAANRTHAEIFCRKTILRPRGFARPNHSPVMSRRRCRFALPGALHPSLSPRASLARSRISSPARSRPLLCAPPLTATHSLQWFTAVLSTCSDAFCMRVLQARCPLGPLRTTRKLTSAILV